MPPEAELTKPHHALDNAKDWFGRLLPQCVKCLAGISFQFGLHVQQPLCFQHLCFGDNRRTQRPPSTGFGRLGSRPSPTRSPGGVKRPKGFPCRLAAGANAWRIGLAEGPKNGVTRLRLMLWRSSRRNTPVCAGGDNAAEGVIWPLRFSPDSPCFRGGSMLMDPPRKPKHPMLSPTDS